MIGIDTNVLLRIFAASEDDPRQSKAARDFLRREAPVFVNPIVLSEFAWTLRRTYKLDRAATLARLSGVVDAPEFSLMFPDETRRAVDLYRSGPADFPDYLIGEIDQSMGCSATVTFDQDAAKCSAFIELQL